MLSRFITETSRAIGGDVSAATLTAPAGVSPSRVVPPTVMPWRWSAARSAPAVNSAGSSTTSW